MDPQLASLLARILNGTDQTLDLLSDFMLRVKMSPEEHAEWLTRAIAIKKSQQRIQDDLRSARATPK